MADQHYEHSYNDPERDVQGDGDLPTYDDLTTQHAHEPNSRLVPFGASHGDLKPSRH